MGNFLLEQRRRTHEQQQIARQLEHEREMRLLEWKRADRLERLAPIRAYVDALSREAMAFIVARRLAERHATGALHADEHPQANRDMAESASRMMAVLEEYEHVHLRCITLGAWP